MMFNQKRNSARSTFWKKQLNRQTTSLPEDIQVWKQQLAKDILSSALIAAILLLASGSYYAYSVGTLWLIPFYAALVGLWVLMTILPKAPHTLRALSPLMLIYAVSVLDLFEAGRTGSARVFLIVLPVLSLLLFDVRAGILALIVSLSTLAGFGWLYATGQLSVSPQVANSADWSIWLSNSVVFVFVTVLLMASANYLINRLIKAVTSLAATSRQLRTCSPSSKPCLIQRPMAFWPWIGRARSRHLTASLPSCGTFPSR
ncbi:MAG: hypothetical protein JXA89_26115 [Anaerolineae bacterium]|nr:hypothetical protein [Anaerolineae bacterium]